MQKLKLLSITMKAATLATAMTIALPCIAGQINLPEVSITVNSATSVTASGSLMGARLSNDTTQRIGCKISTERRSIGGTRSVGECTAINAQGTQASCRTSDAALLQAIAMITESSIISFTGDTSFASGDTCRLLTVESTSAAGY